MIRILILTSILILLSTILLIFTYHRFSHTVQFFIKIFYVIILIFCISLPLYAIFGIDSTDDKYSPIELHNGRLYKPNKSVKLNKSSKSSKNKSGTTSKSSKNKSNKTNKLKKSNKFNLPD